MEVSAEADVGTQLSVEGAQVSLKSCQGKLSLRAVNERKNRSCRENPGMCQERGREGATEVLSKWQSRKMLCTAQGWQEMSTQQLQFVKGSEEMLQT